MNEQSLIDLRNVVKTYRTGAGALSVLKDVSLQVTRGEFVSVVGPSGAGKSTLLNMITGIDRPSEGQVYVDGQAVHRLTENQLARWRGRSVGVIFQFFQLLPTLTIVENVMLPMDFCGMFRGSERRARAMSLLEQMGIADQAYKLPSALSGGEQQRAAIARALANKPPLIVADEPTGNLDTATAEGVFALFDDLVAQGTTLLVVTHDLGLSARARRIIKLRDGRIVSDEPAEALARATQPAAEEPATIRAAAPKPAPALAVEVTPERAEKQAPAVQEAASEPKRKASKKRKRKAKHKAPAEAEAGLSAETEARL